MLNATDSEGNKSLIFSWDIWPRGPDSITGTYAMNCCIVKIKKVL